MKRLGICVFYDNEGIVDKYVCYFLSELTPFLDELCIVINGDIKPNEKQKLIKYTDKILQRENLGLDAYAYKFALEHYGWEKLKDYDEIIMFNTTCFAPIFPFDEMFKSIEEKACDFWGLWKWKAPKNSKWVQGYHIPSFFYGYRKSLIKSPEFKNYWQKMPQIKTYKDAVLYHEQRQTPYFSQKGFKYEVCYELEKYETEKSYWPITKEVQICEKERFPFIKRRGLFIEGDYKNKIHCKRISKLIKTKTNYDIKLICENLKRTQKLKDKQIYKRKIKFLIKIIIYSLLNKKQKKIKYIRNYKNFMTKEEYINLFK